MNHAGIFIGIRIHDQSKAGELATGDVLTDLFFSLLFFIVNLPIYGRVLVHQAKFGNYTGCNDNDVVPLSWLKEVLSRIQDHKI